MVEVFDGLSAIDAPLSEEDRVVYLLASLPESFDVLVTALEANSEVPNMTVVTERLLYTSCGKKCQIRRKCLVIKCFHCGKQGHYKRNCYELKKKPKQKESEGNASITLENDGEA